MSSFFLRLSKSLLSMFSSKSLLPMRERDSLREAQMLSDMGGSDMPGESLGPRPAAWNDNADRKCSAASSYAWKNVVSHYYMLRAGGVSKESNGLSDLK